MYLNDEIGKYQPTKQNIVSLEMLKPWFSKQQN